MEDEYDNKYFSIFVMSSQQADSVIIDYEGKSVACFAVEGGGPHGWCKVRNYETWLVQGKKLCNMAGAR